MYNLSDNIPIVLKRLVIRIVFLHEDLKLQFYFLFALSFQELYLNQEWHSDEGDYKLFRYSLQRPSAAAVLSIIGH